jgi:hypothetical protein
MIERPSDDAIRACVAPTLRAVHASPPGAWASQVLAQLIGLVEYAERRGLDRTAQRRAALDDVLNALAGNPLVPLSGSPEVRASAALAAAVGRAGADTDAEAVRSALRPLLVTELDDELAETTPLLDAFRGRVPDA